MSEVRIAKVPAWHVKELLNRKAEIEEWVLWCEVKDSKSNTWRRFVDFDDMNEHFESWMDLTDIGTKLLSHNLDFVNTFRFNKVRSDFTGVNTLQLDPLFHAVMSNGYATLHELRTIYSLEDVYLMVDSITTTKRNEQLALAAVQEK